RYTGSKITRIGCLMKNEREKLISLLCFCSDDETEATKLQLLTSIMQSEDYDALSKSVALKRQFEDLYNSTKLEELSNSELKNRSSLLHKLVSFNKQLVQSIYSGNGPEMTSEDMPDFTSLKSLTKLCNKLSLSHNIENYSNISENNALAIFSDTTIKSAQVCFDMLPISITKEESIDEASIKQYMGNTLYCFNIEEFHACHNRFLDFSEKSEAIIAKEKFRRRKHRLLKIAVVMVCFGAIYACSQFGLFSDNFTSMLILVMLIMAILFLLWG
ncbi:MAG: hypothetical protein Q4F31_09500, partial [Eubacteriales bacterium]|nr:hypothetical protein [Eubacteriales bacterium]